MGSNKCYFSRNAVTGHGERLTRKNGVDLTTRGTGYQADKASANAVIYVVFDP